MYFQSDQTIPEALKIILDKYPQLHSQLGALAIIKNKALLAKMRKKEYGKKLATTYPILITAAEFIVQTFNDTMKKWIKNGQMIPRTEEESDGSMESEDEMARNANPVNAPISRNQLADALLNAGSSGLPSVRGQQTSGGATLANSRPSTSSSGNANRISSAAFQRALLGAYRGAVQAPPQTPSEPFVVPARSLLEQSQTRFARELQSMREMGLTDEARNIQALHICAGNVESAIELVFSTADL